MNVTLPSPFCSGDNNILSASFSLQSMPHTLFKFDWNIEVRVWKRCRVFSVDPLKENPSERRPLSDFQSTLKAAASKFCAGNPSTNGWKKTLKYRMHKMNIRKIKRSKSSTPRQPKCRLVVFVYVCGLSHGHLGLPKPKYTFKLPFIFLDIFVCESDWSYICVSHLSLLLCL